jgi:hypothetical protein
MKDLKTAAAIKVGYATRDLGLDYLDDGIHVLADEFNPQELIIIRSLVTDISQLCTAQETGLVNNDRGLMQAADSQLNCIKRPALRDCLDRSSLATKSAYAIWYQLGVDWAECATYSDNRQEWTMDTACCNHFTRTCRELIGSQPIAIEPCSRWVAYWERGMEPKAILDRALKDLNADATSQDHEVAISAPLRFLYSIINAAEKSGIGVKCDGPDRPDKFVFHGDTFDQLTGLAFKLVEFLWKQPDRKANDGQIATEVWGDHALNLDDRLGSVRKRANEFFDEHNLPFKVKLLGGYAELVDTRIERCRD